MSSFSSTRTLPPPAVVWAQRKDKLLITVKLENCTDPTVTLGEKSLYFRGNGGPRKTDHEVLLEFYQEVDPEASRWKLTEREIYFVIFKTRASEGFWPRLLRHSTKVQYLKTDFEKWRDEDDSDEEEEQFFNADDVVHVRNAWKPRFRDYAPEEDEFSTFHELAFNVDLAENDDENPQWENCEKNPGHKTMVPVKDLTRAYLPTAWRYENLLWSIKMHSTCVVKITVHYISQQRPDRYVHSNLRGHTCTTSGTGTLILKEETLNSPNVPCKVKNCPLPQPHKTTDSFMVKTATHVVFNQEEAENATVEFFYDSKNDVDKGYVVKADVVDVMGVGIHHDMCTLQCVSHDLRLFEKIRRRGSSEISPRMFLSPVPKDVEPLVVIVAHPHGHYKQVSFGNADTYFESSNLTIPMPSHVWSMKARDFLKLILALSPQAMEIGTNYDGIQFSATRMKQIKYFVDLNPKASVSECFSGLGKPGHEETLRACVERDQKLKQGFLTYTTATCPGSSGAVVLFFQPPRENGDLPFEMDTILTHSRRFNKTLNASGKCFVYPEMTQGLRRVQGQSDNSIWRRTRLLWEWFLILLVRLCLKLHWKLYHFMNRN